MNGADLAVRDTSLAGLTAAWLWSYRDSADTRAAYERDIRCFAGWCAARGLEVGSVGRVQVDAYLAWLSVVPSSTGRPLAPSSVARRLSALSSWFGYLVDAGAVGVNPCVRVRRPRVDKDATRTVGMSAQEALRFRVAAQGDPVLGPVCAQALAGFLVEIGARVSEVCGLDVSDLGHDSGHRTVRLAMKGGKSRVRAIPPDLGRALDCLLSGRSDGPLFTDVAGRRLDRHGVFRFVRRCAFAAGLASANKITPHSLRHAWATIARARGASLERRQHALGHADPRTTQRYDRQRASLDQDPSYLVAGATAISLMGVDE